MQPSKRTATMIAAGLSAMLAAGGEKGQSRLASTSKHVSLSKEVGDDEASEPDGPGNGNP